MKAIYTIHNFAKRLVMMLAVGVFAVNVWGATYTYDFHSCTASSGGAMTYWYSDAGCNTHLSKFTSGTTNQIISSGGTATIYYKDASIPSTAFTISAGNTAYFMSGSSASTAFFWGKTAGNYITLPTYSGEVITKVKVTTSSGVGKSIEVNIYSGTYAASTSYTTTGCTPNGCDNTQYNEFTISDTYQASSLKLQIVTDNKNFQITEIQITTASACDKSVTVSNGGSSTNGSITSITTSPVATCSSTASDRRVSIVVTPSTGYVAPTDLSVGTTTGTVNSSKVSRTDNDNGTFTFVYGYNQNDNGTISYNAACVGKQCTLIFNQNSGTGGQTSNLTATYGSAMPAISGVPTREHYDFEGYYDGAGGTGNKYYNSDGTSATNWNKNTTANTTLYAKWTEHGLKNYRTVCCTDPGLAYETGSVDKTFGDGTFTNALTNTNSVSVTYTSSDETVATVDTDGEVTILKAGTTTITATSAAQKVSTVDYCADEASYTLTVNKADISPTLSYDPSAVTVGNTSSAPTLSGNTGSGSVSYSSSDDAIATVNSSTGVITGVAQGTVTITATIGATTNYNGNTATSNTITINAAACADAFSLHTGTKNGGDWVYNQCFVDADWGADDDAIYTGTFPMTNECYVGWAGSSSDHGTYWAVGGIKTYDIPTGRTLGWNSSNYYESYPGGALGTFHIYKNSTDENYYLRFKPTSYILRTGSGDTWTSRDMTLSASNSHYYETSELDLTSTLISENAYVDLKTSGGEGHVWCNFSSNVTASGNVKVKSSVGDADGNFRGTNLQAGDAGTHGKFRIDITKDVDNWKLAFVPMFRITYAAGTGASGSMDPSSYAEISTTIAAAAESFTDPTGKQFAGWSDGVNTYAAGAAVTMNSNVTLTAQWTDIDYTVTVNQSPSAEATTTGQTSEAHYGGTINLTTTVPSGYAFVNWTTSDGFSITNSTSATTASFTMPAKNVTVMANFVRVDTYMTAMHETDDDWEDYAEGVTKAGDGYTIPNPGDVAKVGTGCEGIHYHFAGWVAEAYKASPSGHIIAASGTTDATGTTYWAVWEKESAGSVDGYLLVESASSLSAGDKILIASAKETSASVLGFQRVDKSSNQTNRGCATSVSITSKVMDPSIASSNSDESKAFEIELQGTSSGWYLYDAVNSGYLQASGGTSSNKLTYNQDGSRDNDDTWTIAIDGTSYAATIKTVNTTTDNRGIMRYNSSDGLFSCYKSGQSDIYVFKYAKSYEDPKVECICSADPVAGTAAVDAEGTFSTSRIDVKATGASTGHTDCSYTDYGFVWSSSVSAAAELKLVEGTGAAAANCTKLQEGTSGEETSFTGSISGSFTANTPIYFRSYVKNGKADGAYQYSSVVTITPRSVTFNLNGHGSSTPATQFVNNGSKATDPSYSESVTGYIFGGWYKEVGCTNQWNFASDVVSGESKTLYAKWTPISYSVRFNNNDENYLGDATGSMSNQSFDYDENKALTANGFSLAGYDFAGWATTPTGDVAHEDEAVVGNLSSTNGATVDLYAIWTAKSYDVTLAATDETSSVGEQVVTATYNAAMPTTKKGSGDVVAPSRTGYTFTGWEYSSTTYYDYNASTSTLSSAHVWDQPNSTTTLTPKWSINSYTLTWNLAGGTVSVDGTGAAEGATGTPSSSVVYNSAITVPTVTKAGYNFAGWDETPASNMPASDVTYTATWTAKTLNSISLEEASVSVYVGEIKYVNVIYDPADILTKGFTQVATPSYCQIGTYASNMQAKITGGRAGATITEDKTETVSIKAKADETKTTSITVTVKPLPLVHFVDNIHNESFADVVATIDDNTLNPNKSMPTHDDVAEPGTGNSCEKTHLHLIGWIRGDWPAYIAYMNGTGDAPSVSELTSATGYWFLPGADINVLTNDGKTFYAVWAVEE